MEQNKINIPFRVLMLITTPKNADRAAEMLQEEKVPLHYRVNAIGTASNEMLDILGLGTPDRSLLVSMMLKPAAHRIMSRVLHELQFILPGNGIAFTLPMTGANNHILKMIKESGSDNSQLQDRKDELIMTDIKRVMIAAVVNHGFSEEVMNAARDAGAGGGTVVHGRSGGNETAMIHWGMSIQEEREIVLIVADVDKKLKIMQAISDKCGMHSDAKGVVMSMPIDAVIGLGS